MRYIADKLEALDHYFVNKSESEKWIMIIVFAGAVAFMAYSYFYPYAKELYDQSIVQKKSIEKKISGEKGYLRSITVGGNRNHYVTLKINEIKQKKGSVANYKKKIATINDNLAKLSDLLFNQKNWSLFLDSITHQADDNTVDLESISNKYVSSKESFGHVLEITLRCTGKFDGIINFINDLEQNTLVTDVYSSRLFTEGESATIAADINISVWGVNH